jgi:Holliday junction resolvasome RuvABC ATP-dependent DNA helicase subunit
MMQTDRIITPETQGNDPIDKALRPKLLQDYIGQEYFHPRSKES